MNMRCDRFAGAARRTAFVACVLFAVGAPAWAQPGPPPPPPAQDEAATPASQPIDPERLALAREYVRESHLEGAMRGIFDRVFRSMPRIGDQADDPRARQFIASLSAGLDSTIPDLLDASAQATARVFTTQELKDLVAFYRTPSGQSMVAKTPELMRQIGPLAFRVLPKMYAAVEKDFCARETCTEADHEKFQRMESTFAGGSPHAAAD